MSNSLKHEFESVLTKHILFKTKVRSYLYGTDIPLEPIMNPRVCSLGKWIYEHAIPVYGHIPQVHELERQHLVIHEYAIKLVKLRQAGQNEKAIEGLAELDEKAEIIASLLRDIEKKAG